MTENETLETCKQNLARVRAENAALREAGSLALLWLPMPSDIKNNEDAKAQVRHIRAVLGRLP